MNTSETYWDTYTELQVLFNSDKIIEHCQLCVANMLSTRLPKQTEYVLAGI